MEDIHTALFQANLLYGIEMDDSDFEEVALIVHKLIGNKNYKLYHYIGHIDPETRSVELPCNCDLIEAVTYSWEDWSHTSNKYEYGDLNTSFIEQYVEAQKHFTDSLYHRGKFVKYHRVGDNLYVDEPGGGPIHILYKGEVVDDTGMPYVNDKEIMAIATYVAYVQYYKEGLKTKNSATVQMAADLKNKAMVQIDQARTPEYLSQNDVDEILEVKTTYNRKVHGRSFKPLM